jgi:molybdopterin molybdotransferase
MIMTVSINDALNIIENQVKALPSEIVPIENVLGRITAETITATVALPSFNNSAMDGFGLKGDSTSYKLIGKILAGDSEEFILNDGECIKIMTGAKVPSSVDTVIQQEFTTTQENTIIINKSVKLGSNIRQCGEDIDIGDTIIEKGIKIYAAHIALFASQGITHVRVFQQPNIAVFASGNELKLHFEKIEGSQIFNSNTPHLIAKSEEFGCQSKFVGKSEDNIDSLKKLINSSLRFDLIVTSGGMSVGEADFTKDAFGELDMEVFFSKIDIKPGRPTAFGKIGDTYILNLPGNPLASALNYEIFGKIITAKLAGQKEAHHNFIQTKLDTTHIQNRAVDTVIPGIFDGKTFKKAEQFKSGMLNVLNRCNGLIIINQDTKEIQSGDIVKFLPINWEFQREDFIDIRS